MKTLLDGALVLTPIGALPATPCPECGAPVAVNPDTFDGDSQGEPWCRNCCKARDRNGAHLGQINSWGFCSGQPINADGFCTCGVYDPERP